MTIDNKRDPTFTVVSIEGYSKPGLLTSLSGTFRDLGLDVGKVCHWKHSAMHPPVRLLICDYALTSQW